MAAELACAVLSWRDEPWLVDAVTSVVNQSVPVEVVVVHSGGETPESRLADAGLHVPVCSSRGRLYPGAVRNIGIDLTEAPFISFLAADCVATPGWAEARLQAHRLGAAAVASALTNACRDKTVAWAALLLLHNRRLAGTRTSQRLLYSMSYARRLFAGYGRFREDLRAGEDTEFNARFAGCEETVFARDVVTAHRYPTSARTMLADAFRRGGLQARMQGAIEDRGPRRTRVAIRGPLAALRSLDVALRSDAEERRLMLRAWPLVVAGGLAYSAGAMISRAGDRD
ncbi:MAG: glycosyltransferase [Gemmatimonadota bacterium]